MSRERIGGDREEIIGRGLGVFWLPAGGAGGLCVCIGGDSMTMKILVLNQSVTVERHGEYGLCENFTVYEPIYVIASHIESFHYAGNTYLKMTSGEQIQVIETTDKIIEMLKDKGFKAEGE